MGAGCEVQRAEFLGNFQVGRREGKVCVKTVFVGLSCGIDNISIASLQKEFGCFIVIFAGSIPRPLCLPMDVPLSPSLEGVCS